MAIFGSYLDKSRSLTGESLSILLLDTCVALTAGLIVFPACFSFNVQPDAGPRLVFITLRTFSLRCREDEFGGLCFSSSFSLQPCPRSSAYSKTLFPSGSIFLDSAAKICRHQHCTYYCIKYSLYSRLQYFIGDTTARSRVEHYGLEDFLVSTISFLLVPLYILCFVHTKTVGDGTISFRRQMQETD